jgi:hypothetical protein
VAVPAIVHGQAQGTILFCFFMGREDQCWEGTAVGSSSSGKGLKSALVLQFLTPSSTAMVRLAQWW